MTVEKLILRPADPTAWSPRRAGSQDDTAVEVWRIWGDTQVAREEIGRRFALALEKRIPLPG